MDSVVNPETTPSPGSWFAAFPSLAGINDECWLRAAASAQEMRIPAGKVVVRKHDPCRAFLLVAQGTVRVYERPDDGREITLYRTLPGDICILTLQSLMQGSDYGAEAATEDDTRLIAIPLPAFQDAMTHSPGFRDYVLSTLARRLADMMRLVEQVTFRNLDMRLACALGQLFGRNDSKILKITHQELARELGSTREVISRVLKELERMGCVRLGRGTIELISHDILVRLSRQISP